MLIPLRKMMSASIVITLGVSMLGFPSGYSQESIVLTGSVQKSNYYHNITLTEPVLQDQEQGVVGLDLLIRPKKYPIVKGVFNNSPAALAGLKSGDVVLEINGESAYGQSADIVDHLISDVPGTPVVLTIRRKKRTKIYQLRVASITEVTPELRTKFTTFVDYWAHR